MITGVEAGADVVIIPVKDVGSEMKMPASGDSIRAGKSWFGRFITWLMNGPGCGVLIGGAGAVIAGEGAMTKNIPVCWVGSILMCVGVFSHALVDEAVEKKKRQIAAARHGAQVV